MDYRYQYNGAEYTIHLEAAADGMIARVGERSFRVEVERRGGGELALMIDGRRVTAWVAGAGRDRYVALAGAETRVFTLTRIEADARRSRDSSRPGGLTAQMPGVVRQVFVAEGEAVAEGQPLLLLEAMKMEIRVGAPAAGIVAHLMVKAGDTVERGQTLAEVVPAQDQSQPEASRG